MRHSTSARRTLAATAAGGLVTAAACVGLASPAAAATPAAKVQATVQTTFSIGSGACTLSSAGTSVAQIVTNQTTGTKKFSRTASATATATNNMDPGDKVGFAATNTVVGSVSAAGGAFTALSATLTQNAKITPTLGLGTDCDPEITEVSVVQAVVHIKRAGKVTINATTPASVLLAQVAFMGADGSSIDVGYQRRGFHTTTRAVKPGDYAVQLQTVTEAMFDDPVFSFEESGRTTFKLTYKKS